MKTTTLAVALLLAAPALAQTITGVAPGRNANAVPPLTTVTASLEGPSDGTTRLSVFSSQADGRKAGTTVATHNTVQFTPAAAFHPGELLTAVYPGNGGSFAQAWQFTAAAASLAWAAR